MKTSTLVVGGVVVFVAYQLLKGSGGGGGLESGGLGGGGGGFLGDVGNILGNLGTSSPIVPANPYAPAPVASLPVSTIDSLGGVNLGAGSPLISQIKAGSLSQEQVNQIGGYVTLPAGKQTIPVETWPKGYVIPLGTTVVSYGQNGAIITPTSEVSTGYSGPWNATPDQFIAAGLFQ